MHYKQVNRDRASRHHRAGAWINDLGSGHR